MTASSTPSPSGLPAAVEARSEDARDCTDRAASTRGARQSNKRRSRMEPHFRGSSSCVEATRGSSGGFTPGAGVDFTVWQGSSRSRSWSRSWSPAKQALRLFLPYASSALAWWTMSPSPEPCRRRRLAAASNPRTRPRQTSGEAATGKASAREAAASTPRKDRPRHGTSGRGAV
jgi:hypothetical protein